MQGTFPVGKNSLLGRLLKRPEPAAEPFKFSQDGSRWRPADTNYGRIKTIQPNLPMTQPMVSPNPPPPPGMPLKYAHSDQALAQHNRWHGSLGPAIRKTVETARPDGTPQHGQMLFLGDSVGHKPNDNQSARETSLHNLLRVRAATPPAPPPSPVAAETGTSRLTPAAPGGKSPLMDLVYRPDAKPEISSMPGRLATGGSDAVSVAGQQPMQRTAATGSPGIAQPTSPTSAYASQSPTARINRPGHPLHGMTHAEAQKVIEGMENRLALPTRMMADENEYRQNPTSRSEMLESLRPQESPLARLGPGNPNRQYSGTGRYGNVDNKLPMARTTEEIGARRNNLGSGHGMTLEQAAYNPNYNRHGQWFQGAGLGIGPNGNPYFRERDRPTDFAGTAANAQEAEDNRTKSYLALQGRNIGKYDPELKAFIGRDARTFPGETSMAGRLVAGGVSPSQLSQQQLEANKQGMLARLAAKKQQAQQIRGERAAAAEIARRNTPSPLMQAMMARDPRLAMQFMALQQQGQLAQNELGLQQQQLQQQNQQFNAGLQAQEKKNLADMTFQEKMALAKQQHDLALQAGNPEFPLRREEMQQRGNQFEAKLKEDARIADAQLKEGGRRADQEANMQAERATLGGLVGLLGNENITPENLAAGLQALLPRIKGQNAPGGVPLGTSSTIPSDSPLGKLLGGQGARTKSYAGGTLNESDYMKARKMAEDDASPDDIVAMLRSSGLSDDQANIALNHILPPNFVNRAANWGPSIFNPSLLHNRSVDDTWGVKNLLTGTSIDPKTGKKRVGLVGRMLGMK